MERKGCGYYINKFARLVGGHTNENLANHSSQQTDKGAEKDLTTGEITSGFRSVVCIHDGWTQPGKYYLAAKSETMVPQPKVDILGDRVKIARENARRVTDVIGSILDPKPDGSRNATLSFAVNKYGFYDFNKHNIPALIEQDPKTQVDTNGLFWFNRYYSRIKE